MELHIHSIHLTAKDDFANRFNYVSDLYQKACKSENDNDWQEYFDAKLSLEMGLPMPLPEPPQNQTTSK